MLPFDVVKVIFYKCDFRTQINIKKSCRKYYTIPIKVIPAIYDRLLNDDILQNYPNLETLYACNNPNITDLSVKELRNLKTLYASNNPNITDHGVKELRNLKSLNAYNNPNITDQGVKELHNLKTLDAYNNPNITIVSTDKLEVNR